MENFESVDQPKDEKPDLQESKGDGLNFDCEVCMDQGCAQCGFGRGKSQAA